VSAPDSQRVADSQVEDLRQRLRTLGYLDAGVDRFVLAPAESARGAAGLALFASLRIGLLAGLLLGPAAALGLSMQLTGLVTGPRDWLVVAVYMALLFGAAVAALALVAGLIVMTVARRAGPALARRGRALSLAAGVLVGLATLAYLTLLWTTVRGVAPEAHATQWIAGGLIVAVAISLLLGHAVTLSALAIIVFATRTPMRTPGVPGASWKSLLVAAAAASAGAVLLFNAGSSRTASANEAPRLTVVPSGWRVRLYAIDGFDPALFEKLAAAGRVPALASALGTASSGARLTLDDADLPAGAEPDPARLWTTIATAQPASVHGVQTLETRRVAGVAGSVQGGDGSAAGRAVRAATDLLRLTTPSIASGSDRREKTFWEVAADAGLRIAVVNWWATWPATADNAIVLTDRATLRLERGGALDAEISPAALYETLRDAWPEIRARAERAATSARSNTRVDPGVAAVLERSTALDAIALALTAQVSTAATDLTVTYLPGLDVAQHALVGPEAAAPSSAAAMSSRLSALEAHYTALDALLAGPLRPGDREIVMIVTAPGRLTAAANGRFVVTGGLARAGSRVGARATDVAPTVLYALGVPISEALAGVPLPALFDPGFVARYPVRQVPTYGHRDARGAPRSGRPLDQEMIDRLRSLGYLK
jgi:hypothetical protein